MKKYKIKISYSKYNHQYCADLLELWFTIPLFGRSFPVYTGVFSIPGSCYHARQTVGYWMRKFNIPQEMVFDSTGGLGL